MPEETPKAIDARAELEAKIKAIKADIPGLESAVAKAVRAIESVPKGSGPQVYVDASGAVTTAQGALDGALADIRRCEKGIEALGAQERYEKDLVAYDESTKACRIVTNPLVSAQQKAVSSAKDTFAHAGVNSVVTRTTLIEGEILTVVELVGPNKPRQPKKGRQASSGNGRGFSKRLYATPQGDLSQTDVFKSYAIEAGVSQERYDLVLADPSNQGISHRGKAVAEKMEFVEVTPS